MNDRFIVLGSKGQLGTALCELFKKEGFSYLGLDLPEFDITKPVTYKKKIKEYSPDVIINCSAYTDVYKAEKEHYNALNINALSLKSLIDLCNKYNILFCHISTDYVFSGEKQSPYIETDTPNPINYYGLSKYMGEKLIQFYSDNYVIIRTSALYGKSINKSQNIVDKLIEITRNNKLVKLVKDEYISPTYTKDLAKQIILIIENNINGVVHATSEGYCNWVEMGKYLYDILGIKVKIEEVKSSFFNKTLAKPKFSVLENKVLKEKNINVMPDWEAVLRKYLENNKFNHKTIEY